MCSCVSVEVDRGYVHPSFKPSKRTKIMLKSAEVTGDDTGCKNSRKCWSNEFSWYMSSCLSLFTAHCKRIQTSHLK